MTPSRGEYNWKPGQCEQRQCQRLTSRVSCFEIELFIESKSEKRGFQLSICALLRTKLTGKGLWRHLHPWPPLVSFPVPNNHLMLGSLLFGRQIRTASN